MKIKFPNIRLGIIALAILPFISVAQFIPLDNHFYNLLTQKYQQENASFLSSMKPVLMQELDSAYHIDSVIYPTVFRKEGRKNTWVYRKIFNESLIRYRTKDFWITADPVFNFSGGYDLKEPKFAWTNTRGFTVTGALLNKVFFNAELYENQAVFASWPDSMVRQTGVVPGQGGTKPFKEEGYDYLYSSGYLTYTPVKYINMTLGYGKNFIGDGYRSMILSDASFNYPYVALTANFKKVKYTVLYNQFIDRSVTSTVGFGNDRKWSTMHYLQIMLWKRLTIGLFDAIVWENADSAGYRGFEFQYLNPVIFLMRPIESSFGSPDNSVMGATFNLRINRFLNVYGQVFLDEFKLDEVTANTGWWGNKFGYQLGVAGWNLFDVPALNARFEFNQARPYTYSYANTTEAYGHYNQPLAHPLGANFREFILMSSYTRNNWMISFKLNFAMYGIDTAGLDYGKDIFIPYDQRISEYGNEIGQGLKTKLFIGDLNVAYLLNRRTNMRLEAGVTIRNENNAQWDKQMHYLYFGLKTGLRNIYYDF